MSNETKQNLKNSNTWKRILFMFLFVFAYGVVKFVMAVVIISQVFFKLITGSVNEPLLMFGKQLSLYIYDLLLFLTFNSEDMPFPFAAWPEINAR